MATREDVSIDSKALENQVVESRFLRGSSDVIASVCSVEFLGRKQ